MREFRLYGARERAAVREALDHVLCQWGRTWLNSQPMFTARVAEVKDCYTSTTKCSRVACGNVGVSYKMSGAFFKQLALGAGWCDALSWQDGSTLWEQTVEACIQDFVRQVLQCVVSSDANFEVALDCLPDIDCSAYASGYLVYEVQLGTETLSLLLNPVWVASLLKPAALPTQLASLCSRVDAVANGMCKLEVVAGTAELTVEELNTLSPGCVVRLDKLLDQAFDLRELSGQFVGKVYLAACGDDKAIQIAQS